ncbi:MAG: NUDIX domain-containing protein [Catalinimonas sp.]
MKIYAREGGRPVTLAPLLAERMEQHPYEQAHRGMVLACHDVMIAYDGGLLLIVRDNAPARDELWCIGGRMERGMTPEASAEQKVREECGLTLRDLRTMGCARTWFQTDPFGHGGGTDSFNLLMFGRGEGELRLDALHSRPRVVRPADYTEAFRADLHPYIRDFMDDVMPLL